MFDLCLLRPGLLNVGICSSANSIWYYIPWFYSSFFATARLVRKGFSPLLSSFIGGMFAFSFCGAYEMQGPALRYWQWPDTDNLTYASNTHTHSLTLTQIHTSNLY